MKDKRIYHYPYTDLLTDDTIRKIKFHVRCCLHRNRPINICLGQIYRNWGFRDQVTHIATQAYNNGL